MISIFVFDSNSDTHKKFEAIGDNKGASYDCKVDPPFVGYVSDSFFFCTCNK